MHRAQRTVHQAHIKGTAPVSHNNCVNDQKLSVCRTQTLFTLLLHNTLYCFCLLGDKIVGDNVDSDNVGSNSLQSDFRGPTHMAASQKAAGLTFVRHDYCF